MLIHDYPVRRRMRDDLEREALRLRSEWGFGPADQVDVFELLFVRMPESLKKLGLKMTERAAGFMGERAAYAAPKSKRIFYRASLLAQLRLGGPEASIIFLHELSHVLLHPGAEKAWVISGNLTPNFITEEESAEWQATVLSLCLKAPKAAAIDCQSADELAKKFGLSIEHAGERFEMLRRQKKRALPESYHRFKAQAKGHDTLTKAPTLPLVGETHLGERCSFCGRSLLRAMGNKYRCDGCRNYSDQFQDGDLVGFEPW